MKLPAPPRTPPTWVRWPAVSLLFLVWAVLALAAWSLGGLGTWARRGASFVLGLIESLNS